MGFLKNHGEKLLLIVLLAGVVLSLLSGITTISTLEDPDGLALRAPKGNVKLEVDSLDATISRITDNPPQVGVEIGMFTPEVRVICINQQCRSLIRPDAETCVYCGEVQTVGPRDTDGDGITDSQEAAWGMNPLNPDDVFLDQDDDGFPTLYEAENGTDPTNASSSPELIKFLRLKDINQTSIQFELRGTAKLSGNYTLQLFWKYPGQSRGQTDYIRTGENFGQNNEFRLVSFSEKRVQEGGRFVDKSEALIQSGRYQLTLGRTPETRSGSMTERIAVIEAIFGPDFEEEIRVDETITVGKKTYNVVDITEDAVVLQPNDESEPDPEAIVIKAPTPEDEEALEKFRPGGASENKPLNGSGGPSSPDFQDFF